MARSAIDALRSSLEAAQSGPRPNRRELVSALREALDVLAPGPADKHYLDHQLLVRLHSDTTVPGTKSGTKRTLAPTIESPFRALERKGLILDVAAIHTPEGMEGTRAAAALAASVTEVGDPLLRGWNLVRLGKGANRTAVERELGAAAGVASVERVPFRRLVARRSVPMVRSLASASPGWNLVAIGRGPTRLEAVTIAVLDTGVDASHPALSVNPANCVFEGASDEDIVGHGTHVCGIIAGQPGVEAGFEGVSTAELRVWKIFGDEPDPQTNKYYVDERMYQRALVAASRSGIRVMNLSIGGTRYTTTERDLFRRIIGDGIVVCAAMGNEYESGNPVEYPAAYTGVIAVGSVGVDLTRSSFSNTGNHIALVASGEQILSTVPTKASVARRETNYATWSGTSMATPHVAAAAAVLLQRHPSWTATDVVLALRRQARRLPAMGDSAWTRTLGAGLLFVAGTS